jgi:hypothetical protein
MVFWGGNREINVWYKKNDEKGREDRDNEFGVKINKSKC